MYRDLNIADENGKSALFERLLYIDNIFTVIPKSAQNLTKPVLLLTAAQDLIGTPSRAEGSTSPFVCSFKVQEIDSGHFLMLEKADEVNKALSDFFEDI